MRTNTNEQRRLEHRRQRSTDMPYIKDSGVKFVRFEITALNCELCYATATVISRPVGISRVPEEDEYGQITVWDFHNCHLNAPEDDLIGLTGAATYMQYAANPGCGSEPSKTKFWEIIQLCCSEDGCE
jgi:hypothetical protein